MAQWLIEDGIGERRAALIAGGRIVEMALEWDDDPCPRAGAICPARLLRGADATGRAVVRLESGPDIQLAPVPLGLAEGARLLIEIVREALPEAGGLKPARARAADPGAVEGAGPDLIARLRAGSVPMRLLAGAETLRDHGWDEHMEEAESGIVARPEALLRISPTPAMTLIDVDGSSAPLALALAGARLAGEAIRRFGIAGSIGIDLPTLTGKADRQAAAAALDAALPQPFERTAVNGFGFLQLVRRRERRSVVERLHADPAGAAARALLAQAARAAGAGEVRLVGHPRVIDRIAAGPGWVAQLESRLGAPVALRRDGALAISQEHVTRAYP